jgi:Asp-tRNA(Asn)/Glu-tRNA(Gln) amidotransferase C subunit
MKKSQNKLNEEDLLKDIDTILNYTNALSTLDIENTDLDKMENEIEDFGKNLRKKYKEYLSKEDLDSKK